MASAFSQGFRMGSDIYDSSERMKLAKEQQEWAREEQEARRGERQREADIRTAGAETLGMEGKPVEYLGGTGIDRGPQPAEAQTALRSDIATAPAKMYTADQASQDYLKRLRGLDVGKAMQYEKGALEVGELQRSKRYNDKQELALGFDNQVRKDLVDAKGDAATVIENTFLPLYNADKLPGFKDGGTAKLVPSAVGGEKSIVITYKDGKQEVLPANLDTLQKLSRYTQDEMMKSSTPENYWKAKTQATAEKNAESSAISAGAAALNAQTNADELKQKIKADLFGVEARLKGAQAGQASAMAKQATAHAAVYDNMVKLGNENREAGQAVKEALAKYEALSDSEKAGEKGQAILIEGAFAAAKKTGDMTRIMDVLKKPDRSTVSAEMEKAAYALYNEAIASNDEARVKAVKKAYPQVFGEDDTTKAIKAAIEKRNSPQPGPAAAPAAPTPASPVAAAPAAIPTNALASNPYRTVMRGNTTVDQAAIQKDLAEYKSLQNSAVPITAGRRAFLEQKLRAAGVLPS
jgi:hypothetical protein